MCRCRRCISSNNASGAHAAPLRVGLAGLGFGGGVHLPVFRSLPGIEVSALLGRDAGKVGAMAERFGVPGACTSMDEFLDSSLDAVVIALPPEPAGRLAAAALDRGLAILAEKPIAATATEAEALAARAAGLTTMVDFEFRELPSFKALKTMIVEGRLGAIDTVHICWRSCSYTQRNRIWSWKADAAQGGGVLTLSGLHLVNLLEWLFGPVSLESARTDDSVTRSFTPSGARPAPETADLILHCSGDITVVAHLSNAALDRHGHRWKIDAEHALVTLDDAGDGTFGPFVLTMQPHDGQPRTVTRDPASDGDYRIHPVAALAKRFAAAAYTASLVAPSFDECASAQRTMASLRHLEAEPPPDSVNGTIQV